MKTSYQAAIGRPRMHLKDEVTGFALDMTVPRGLMLDIARENLHWLLHNGTDAERTEIKAIARDIGRVGLPHPR